MIISFSHNDILNILKRSMRGLSPNSINVLSGYTHIKTHDGVIEFRSSDGEMSLTISHRDDGISAGIDTLIPTPVILNIILRSDKEKTVDFKFLENELRIRSGHFKSSVNTLPSADYYDFNFDGESLSKLSFPAGQFINSLKTVDFSASRNDTRFYLNGVFFEKKDNFISFVGTDGHRLALRRFSNDQFSDFKGVIIPIKSVGVIESIFTEQEDIDVSVFRSHVCLKQGDVLYASKLIEGSFPEYERVIPQRFAYSVDIGSDLKTSVDYVSAVSTAKSRPVKFLMSEGNFTVSCMSDLDNSKSVAPVNASPDFELTIGFQARYIMDVISQFNGSSTWKFNDNGSPVGIFPNNEYNDTFVLMPLRV